MYTRCVTVLESTGCLPSPPVVDEYLSVVCEVLRLMEPVSCSTHRGPVKSKRAEVTLVSSSGRLRSFSQTLFYGRSLKQSLVRCERKLRVIQ